MHQPNHSQKHDLAHFGETYMYEQILSSSSVKIIACLLFCTKQLFILGLTFLLIVAPGANWNQYINIVI